MIPTKKRTEAYATIRMVNNAGITLGPARGGFIVSRSYTYAFVGAVRE